MHNKKKSSKKVSKNVNYYYFYLLLILMLILSLINISNYLFLKKQTVLGIETQNEEGVFWYNFLQKNPNYIPGWIEIGRPDKVKKIDPNYF